MLITLTTFGKVHKLWISWLSNFLQPPVTSCLLRLHFLLRTSSFFVLSLC